MSPPSRPGPANGAPLLAYSTNVHPGGSLDAVLRSLREYTLPIRRRVFGSAPAGLELRLGIGAARELRSARRREELAALLEEAGLLLFSVNAYPLRDFHARRVKEEVYRPSWTTAARARWTAEIARLFASLLPEGLDGSISTLGGGYRGDGHGEAVLGRMARRYLETLEALLELEREGRRVVLAVEPEPDTTFETASDVVRFVEEWLLPAAFESWKGRGRRAWIEERVRRLFTVNLDTCHLSVLFRDPARAIEEIEAAGLRVGKLHVTNAVALRNPHRSPVGYRELRAMDEPRYLHQFRGRDGAGSVVWSGTDLSLLPARLEGGRDPEVTELRSHFHVPLYRARLGRLRTTRDETERALRLAVRRGSTRHIVMETYTWPIFASGAGRRRKLIEGIAREFRWTRAIIESARSGGGRGRRR